MTYFRVVLLFALLLCSAAFARELKLVSAPAGGPMSEPPTFPPAREGVLTTLQAGFTPEGDFQCAPERGYIRDRGTYNDPNSTITESPLQCCRLCFDDQRCQTWTRERSTGTCALMDVAAPLEQNPAFDSGVLDAADAQETITAADCEVVRGVYYPSGTELEQTTTPNARRCCELCRDNGECFSWYHHRPTRRCILNEDSPDEVSNDEYTGSAFT